MSNDSEIAVKLTAKADGVAEGTQQARDELGRFVAGATSDLHRMAEASEETESALKELLSIESFRFIQEQAQVAFETLKQGFESTVGKAEEFGLSTEKFASVMGTSVEHAAGLSAALENVGSSTDAYESIALRLGQTLEKAGGPSQALKDQFKDANGQFLVGAPLMERLKEVTDSYAEGADRTAVTTALLGKRTKDYYDISRVTAESIDHQTGIYKEFGVNLATIGEQSRKLEEAEGDLRTAWKAEQIVIGQELMPIMQSFFQWMSGDGKQILQAMEVGVKALMTGFAALKTAVVEAVIGMTGTLATLWESLKLGGTLLKDVLTGDFSSITKDWEAGTQKVKDAWTAMGRAGESEMKDFDQTMSALWDRQATKAAESKKQGGKAAPAQLYSGGKTKDNSAETEIADAAKLAEAKIALEEQTNQHLLAMGKETADQFVAIERDLEDRKFLIQQTALEKEMALPGKTKAERAKLLDDILQLEVTHQGALLKIDQEGEARKAEVARGALQDAIKDADERLKTEIKVYDDEFAQGQISAAQKYAIEKKLTDEIRQEQLKRLTDAMAALDAQSTEYEKLKKQRDALTARGKQEDVGLNKDLWKNTFDQVKGYSEGFFSSFNQGINSMITAGKSFGEVMKEISKSMASALISDIEKAGEKFIEQQITNALVATTTTQTSALAQMSANAGVAATAGAASQAGIPIVGPALAAGAAAAMLALCLGFESLAHASGGMLLDRDQLVFAHKGEQILPSNISSGLTQMIQGGGGSRSASLNYAPTINAPQPASLGSMLRTDSGAMLSWIKQQQRDGRL